MVLIPGFFRLTDEMAQSVGSELRGQCGLKYVKATNNVRRSEPRLTPIIHCAAKV